jgi:hypothetical protein
MRVDAVSVEFTKLPNKGTVSMSWCSLFLPSENANQVVTALQASLERLGYTAFNPFGLMPGLTYPRAVRLFVAPAQAGWVRVIGEPDEAQLPILSQKMPCLLVELNGAQERVEALVEGWTQPLASALAPYLKPNVSVEMLERALSASISPMSSGASDVEFFNQALPDSVKTANVDMRQAQKMFDRLSAGLTQRSGNTGKEAAARDLLQGQRPDWNSAGGTRIRGLMDCLTIPPGWGSPDFVTLRDAYQLHERRRRTPNAMLYPGDAEAMADVPNALDYAVVYAGKG